MSRRSEISTTNFTTYCRYIDYSSQYRLQGVAVNVNLPRFREGTQSSRSGHRLRWPPCQSRPQASDARDCFCPSCNACSTRENGVPSAIHSGSSSDCDARMPWMVASGASKAPAASRATSEQLARSVRLLLAALRPLWPPGWTAPGRSLGAQRVGAACCTVTASELCVVFVRRIWQLIAGLHRYRATARLWCNGDRSVVR